MMQSDINKSKLYLEQVKQTLQTEVVPDLAMAKKMIADVNMISVHTSQIQNDLYREVTQLVLKADLLTHYVELAIESCNTTREELEYYGEA